MLLYEKVFDELKKSIDDGLYAVGDRLPGVRKYSKTRGVSVSTVLSAYYQLEDDGYVESIIKSGFYVKNRARVFIESPEQSSPISKPKTVTGQEMVLQMIKSINIPSLTNFGTAAPASSFLPTKLVSDAVIQVSRTHSDEISKYESPLGNQVLRQSITRRMTQAGCKTSIQDVLITVGCQEAIHLALMACTNPGEVVAVESPTYYGFLQIIDSLNLKALEIPTDPKTGISLSALKLAIEQWPIKACVLVPTFSNPLGSCIPDNKREALVTLLTESNVTLIEDDVYGELAHNSRRPPTLKSFDKTDNVIYCSSFSKSLSPGLRVGWVASKKYVERIEYLKYVLNFSTTTVSQLAVAKILDSGKFDRYLNKARREYAVAVPKMINAIYKLFPEGTKVTQPIGGYVIWVEFPHNINTSDLANELLVEGISIAPGNIFSAVGKYDNFMRISCACKWTEDIELALLKIVKYYFKQKK